MLYLCNRILKANVEYEESILITLLDDALWVAVC